MLLYFKGSHQKLNWHTFKLALGWFYSTYAFKLFMYKYKNNMTSGYFPKTQNISFSWMCKIDECKNNMRFLEL